MSLFFQISSNEVEKQAGGSLSSANSSVSFSSQQLLPTTETDVALQEPSNKFG